MKLVDFFREAKFIRGMVASVTALILIISLSRTFLLVVEYRALSEQLSAFENMTFEPVKYRADDFKSTDVNSILFDAISTSARMQNVEVNNINSPKVNLTDDIKLITEEIVLGGSVVDVLRCLDQANKNLGLIKVSSLRFERVQKSKSEKLLTTVYFQMVNVKANEEK